MNLYALHNVLYQVLYCIIITNLYALHYDYYIFLHYNNELCSMSSIEALY